MIELLSINSHDANSIDRQTFWMAEPVELLSDSRSIGWGCVFKSLDSIHHILSLSLLVMAFDMAFGIALACYGLTIGLVYLTLRITNDRNIRYAPVLSVAKRIDSKPDVQVVCTKHSLSKVAHSPGLSSFENS